MNVSAHDAYRDWMLTKLDNDRKIKDAREQLAKLEYELNAKTEAKYQAFKQAMGDQDEVDGIIRKRPDPTKKNSYEVHFKLTPTELAKLATESEALKAIMKLSKPKETPNQSLVKQYLASGRFVKSGDHLVDQATGELLDAYIDVHLKEDDFKEVKNNE